MFLKKKLSLSLLISISAIHASSPTSVDSAITHDVKRPTPLTVPDGDSDEKLVIEADTSSPQNSPKSPKAQKQVVAELTNLFAQAQKLSSAQATGGSNVSLKHALAVNSERLRVAQSIIEKLEILELGERKKVKEYKELLNDAQNAHDQSTPQRIAPKAFKKSRELMEKSAALNNELIGLK